MIDMVMKKRTPLGDRLLNEIWQCSKPLIFQFQPIATTTPDASGCGRLAGSTA